MSAIRPNLLEDDAQKRNQHLNPSDVVELLAAYNARAQYAAAKSRKDVHDTWHEAMDMLLGTTGVFTPAPCFCKFEAGWFH